MNPFQILGVPQTFAQDEEKLEEIYFELAKKHHPDRFATAANDIRLKNQEVSATLNTAYLALKNKENRLETLLSTVGAIKENDQHTEKERGNIPTELAEEFFEIQEAVMEDPVTAKTIAANFRSKITQKHQELTTKMYNLAGKTDWTTSTDPQISELVNLRRERSYLRSMLENLERLGV